MIVMIIAIVIISNVNSVGLACDDVMLKTGVA